MDFLRLGFGQSKFSLSASWPELKARWRVEKEKIVALIGPNISESPRFFPLPRWLMEKLSLPPLEIRLSPEEPEEGKAEIFYKAITQGGAIELLHDLSKVEQEEAPPLPDLTAGWPPGFFVKFTFASVGEARLRAALMIFATASPSFRSLNSLLSAAQFSVLSDFRDARPELSEAGALRFLFFSTNSPPPPRAALGAFGAFQHEKMHQIQQSLEKQEQFIQTQEIPQAEAPEDFGPSPAFEDFPVSSSLVALRVRALGQNSFHRIKMAEIRDRHEAAIKLRRAAFSQSQVDLAALSAARLAEIRQDLEKRKNEKVCAEERRKAEKEEKIKKKAAEREQEKLAEERQRLLLARQEESNRRAEKFQRASENAAHKRLAESRISALSASSAHHRIQREVAQQTQKLVGARLSAALQDRSRANFRQAKEAAALRGKIRENKEIALHWQALEARLAHSAALEQTRAAQAQEAAVRKILRETQEKSRKIGKLAENKLPPIGKNGGALTVLLTQLENLDSLARSVRVGLAGCSSVSAASGSLGL